MRRKNKKTDLSRAHWPPCLTNYSQLYPNGFTTSKYSNKISLIHNDNTSRLRKDLPYAGYEQ